MPRENRELLTDIRLQLRDNRLRPIYSVETVFQRIPNRPDRLQDIAMVSGRDNLAQAIIMRLLTPLGELNALGHPEYGSRVHELIGSRNTETTRNLLSLYLLESLQQEPRIAEVESVRVDLDPVIRERVNVQLQVKPTDDTGSVTIGPFTLEFEP